MTAAAPSLAAARRDDESLWVQLRIALAGSRPVIASAIAAVLFYVATYFNPFQAFWRVGFQAGHIYQWWPLVIYGAAVAFPILGWREHRRTGEAIYRPGLAVVAGFPLCTIPLVLITDWSASRSAFWFYAVLWLGAAGAFCVAVGTIVYRESWRTRNNRAVCARTRDALRGRWFRRWVRGLIRRNSWAAPHCLLVVDGYYEEAKSDLRNHLRERVSRHYLDACIHAGEMLVAYLRLRRNASLAATADWTLRRIDVLRELATLSFWAAEANKQLRIDTDRINGWMDEMERALPAALHSYVVFLRAVFNLRTLDAADAERLLVLFRDIPSADARAIASDTWIAVAPMRIDAQTALDFWIALHGPGVDPLTTMRTDARDPAAAWAHERLARLYDSWVQRTARDWRGPVEARSAIATAAALLAPIDPAVIRRETEARAGDVPSWPYRYVWSAPAVLARLFAWTTVVALIHTVAVLGVIPGVMYNNVESVRDLHPVRDYRHSEIRAMAATPDAIALASSEGLLLVDKTSRVITPKSDTPALDVTRGPGDDGFIALGEDQSIRAVTPDLLGDETVWIASPAQPEWTGNAGAPVEIVRSAVDADGWLIAARRRGVARYRFEAGIRTRSWQQSELSAVDLRDAIFTEAGAWIRTPSSVAFADRKTLQPRAERNLAIAAEAIDGDTAGTWATARTGGSAWLFDESWRGPFFCSLPNALTDLSEVTHAGLKPNLAWLGTATGLYRYNTLRRCLSTAIEGQEIRYLAPAKTQSMVVATNETLWLAPTAGEPQVVDRVTRLWSPSLSPDGTIAFYGADEQLRRLDVSVAPPAREIVVDGEGWRTESQPEMLAVRAENPASLLFVTAEGAFRYDPRRRTYEDVSKGEGDTILQSFRGVELAPNRILAIADGSPYALPNGAKAWRPLDPSGERDAVQVTEAAGQAFGVGEDGRIHRYESGAQSFLTSHSAALQRYGPERVFRGDLLPGDAFRVAIAAGTTLVESKPGTLELEDHTAQMPQEVRQLRYTADGALLMLTADAAVRRAPAGGHVFGHGHLRIPLEQIATMISDRDGKSVIVGGSGGTVATYDWPTGSWTPAVTPWDIDQRNVTSLQKAAGGLLIGTSEHAWYYSNGTNVTGLGLRRRVVATGDRIVALDGNGIHSMQVTGTTADSWPSTTYAAGRGVATLLAKAVIAWQPDPGSFVFLARDGTRGRYRVATDSWEVVGEGTIGRLDRIHAAGTSVFAADGPLAIRIDGDLRVRPVAAFSVKPSFHVSGSVVRVAGVWNGAVVLRTDDGQKATRGGVEPPANFDLADVVHASKEDSLLVLVDRRGQIATYDPVTGAWSSRFIPNPFDRLVGWTKPRFTAGKIFLRSREGKTASVRLNDGRREVVDQAPDKLVTPTDGQLVSADGISVTRILGVTTAVHETLGPLHFHPGFGFEEDWYSDAAFDANGELHAMTAAGALRLRQNNDGTLAAVSPPEKRPLPSPLRDSDRVFFTQDIGGHELRWTYRPGRGIQPEWRELALPRIGSCGRPSWQCAVDVAAAPTGELLVSTDLGVMVRDANTYTLRQLFTQLAGASFIASRHAVYIRTPAGRLYSWSRSKGLEPRTAIPPTIAATGPLRWTGTASGGVTVTKGNRPARMFDTAAGAWRFDDDVVRWIHRGNGGIVLETEGDRWTFAGIRGDRFAAAPTPDRFRQQTPAVTITSARGVLTFDMFDGNELPAIVDGRFVLNGASQIAGSGTDLFLLVDGRCVVRRSTVDPHVITGVWSLPPGASGAVLDPIPAGVRLKHAGIAYSLDPRGGQWAASQLPPFEEAVGANLIIWRGQRGREARYVPHHGASPLPSWWRSRAFAWDRVSHVVTLSRDLIAVASGAGLWTGRHSKTGLETVDLVVGVSAVSAAEARRNGERIGALFADSTGKEWLATTTGELRPHDGSEVRERAVVTFALRDRLLLEQSWQPAGNGPAARSTIAPDLVRIDRGQFAFDGFRSGAVVSGLWLIASPREPAMVSVNELTSTGLELRGLFRAPCPFAHLRSGAVRAIGVCEGNRDAWTFDRASATWQPTRTIPASEFRVGQHVAFSAGSISWHASGNDLPWSSNPLTIQPAQYPLFSATDTGILLSFDRFTAVSYDRTGGTLAVGTRGGVLRGSWRAGGARLLRHDGTFLDFNGGAPQSEWLLDVVRLRGDGKALLALTATVTSLEHRNGVWLPSPLTRWPFSASIFLHGARVTRSDNSWGRGDRPLEGIVELEVDESATWVVTRRNGLFRIAGASAR